MRAPVVVAHQGAATRAGALRVEDRRLPKRCTATAAGKPKGVSANTRQHAHRALARVLGSDTAIGEAREQRSGFIGRHASDGDRAGAGAKVGDKREDGVFHDASPPRMPAQDRRRQASQIDATRGSIGGIVFPMTYWELAPGGAGAQYAKTTS